MKKILITGASGMIGHTIARILTRVKKYNVIGIGRRELSQKLLNFNYIKFEDLTDFASVNKLFLKFQPDILINCSGLTKHVKINDPVKYIYANSILPHYLSTNAKIFGTRFIHISTDCVFSGKRGNYDENDICDASDIYGRTKALGENISNEHLVLRTSTIGHELDTKYGLLEWFLSQKISCKGYESAYFSGLTTLELSRLILDIILPNESLKGLYNISSSIINKYDLLKIISRTYKYEIIINSDKEVCIDRSLNSSKFISDTGYFSPDWPELINQMYYDKINKI